LGDIVVDGRITLKYVLKKLDISFRAPLSWLWINTNGGPL